MITLDLDSIIYEWNEDAKWTNKEGQTFSFASLKKTSTFKNNKKYQNLTVKPEHIEKFKEFLRDIIGAKSEKKEELPPDDDVPF